ncbi:UNVERIFIED_CONTAM: Acetylornithine deacetylase [Sesamum latifolium]|uniref:Acetylornithine deacetylase n=1 Tax=Sesamum latifolium TaxID=2727402 RepID=A0AAW2X2T0_9LAMI
MAAGGVKQALGELNKDSFVTLLSKLIGESKYVQNNPPDLIPEEDRIVRHVLDVLRPFSTATGGGPLVINHVAYKPNRGNLIVEYPGTQPGKILSFVGMHMDVVTAIPSEWDFDPFTLSIDGDKLRGRGTTDCLGHVALVAELMRRLGETKPQLKSTVVAVFIASEENSSIPGVGVDALVKDKLLDKLKQGPLFWIDTADKQPCIGTGGMIPWKLHVSGKLFHSGLAHKAINPLELAMEALKEIQSRFYRDFPPHQNEKVYGFATPSTMKPTQWSYPGGGINQIPAECTVCGDVRLTISFDEAMSGVACNLDSRGFHVLCKATEEVVGHVKPYSITGSLPLIRELQEEGFDVQTSGYGIVHFLLHASSLLYTIARLVLGDSWFEVAAPYKCHRGGESLLVAGLALRFQSQKVLLPCKKTAEEIGLLQKWRERIVPMLTHGRNLKPSTSNM